MGAIAAGSDQLHATFLDPRNSLPVGTWPAHACHGGARPSLMMRHGVAADIAIARTWYEKAKEFGSRLELLVIQHHRGVFRMIGRDCWITF